MSTSTRPSSCTWASERTPGHPDDSARTPKCRRRRGALSVVAVVALGVLTGCSGAPEPSSASASSGGQAAEAEMFPDVQDAEVTAAGDAFDVDATISSPYDSPDRYADAFRVRSEDGTVYGVRELTHDHASEQPFTRTLNGAEIPDDVDEVVVEGRDQVSGWGGATVTVPVTRG